MYTLWIEIRFVSEISMCNHDSRYGVKKHFVSPDKVIIKYITANKEATDWGQYMKLARR